MLLAHRRRWLPEAASAGTSVLLALALSGCGGSSLKTPKGDAGIDGLGGGFADGPEATGGAVWGLGGATGRATGGLMATGGVAGAGGLTGRGGSTDIGAGGGTRNGGTTGIGGLPGRGGSTGTAAGGSPGRGGAAGTAVGGTTSTGGKPASGGTTGTGGRTGGTGGRDGTGGDTGGSTAAVMLRPLVDAFCTAADSCCARASYPKADLADCRPQFPSRFPYYALVDKGTVTVDEDALAACVAAYNAAGSTCTVTGLNAACAGIFVGAQAEGQPCGGTGEFGAYECKPADGSASCYWQDSGSHPTKPGVCLGVPRGKAGDLCSRTCLKGEACIVDLIGGAAPFPVTCFEEDGLYCSVASNPAICKPLLRLDDACTWDTGSCGSGNYCHWTTNTCQPASKLGESCESALCMDELECGANQTCIESFLASESVCGGTPSVP